MSKKYRIAKNRVVDIDAIQDADTETVEGQMTLTFRLAGHERPFRIAGKMAQVLWLALEANSAPIYAASDDQAERV